MGDLTRLSVVVVTWNEKSEVVACVESLLRNLDMTKDEVIVIDNGSIDDTSIELNSLYGHKIKYLNIGRNIGVGPARNRGIQLARGNFIMVLDNDARLLTEDPARIIESIFEGRHCVGVVGFKMQYPDGSLQRSARRFPKIVQPLASRTNSPIAKKFLLRLQHNHLMIDEDFEKLSVFKEVDYLIGANQVFSRGFINEVGGYDEKMFYGAEDCEICFRSRKLGFHNYYSTGIIIEHRHIRRSTKSKRFALRHTFSFLYMFIKHRRIWSLSAKRDITSKGVGV